MPATRFEPPSPEIRESSLPPLEFTSLSAQWFVHFKIKKACLTFAAHCRITVYICLHSEILNFEIKKISL